jgi:hypothetical protein
MLITLTAYLKGFVGELSELHSRKNEMQTHPFPTQMPVWRHPDASVHRLPVAHITYEDEAWSGGMIWVVLGADDTKLHG